MTLRQSEQISELSPNSRQGGFLAGYRYQIFGGTVNSTSPETTPAIMLVGGAEAGTAGEDAATQWFLDNAGGGDYLVIRFGQIGGQAEWVWENYSSSVSSAAELAINTRRAANNPEVAQYILDAEALFIAGGDQNSYEDFWKDTLVEDAINYLVNTKEVPVGGTSAGMVIMGESYYAPEGRDLLSSEILRNPYHPNTEEINHGDFLDIPILNNLITDTHLDREHGNFNENRYGRIFGFLSRVVADNEDQLPSYAIGLEEGGFVGIDANGIAQAFGNGNRVGADAYFLQTNGVAPETISPRTPLVWDNQGEAVRVYRIPGSTTGSGSFNLNDWATVSGGSWESWYTTGGLLGFTRDSDPTLAVELI